MIPSEEDFRRAKSLMDARMREEGVVRRKLEPMLKLLAPVSEVVISKNGDTRWAVWAFVPKEADARRAVERGFLENGMERAKQAIRECGYAAADLKLFFRIESDEQANRHPAHRYNTEGRPELVRVSDGFFDPS